MAYTATTQPAHNWKPNSTYARGKHNDQNKLMDEVADGQLTQQQEQLILAKYKSMHQSGGSWKNMSASQRKTARQQMNSQMQSWAQDNGIAANLL